MEYPWFFDENLVKLQTTLCTTYKTDMNSDMKTLVIYIMVYIFSLCDGMNITFANCGKSISK